MVVVPVPVPVVAAATVTITGVEVLAAKRPEAPPNRA